MKSKTVCEINTNSAFYFVEFSLIFENLFKLQMKNEIFKNIQISLLEN